MQTHNIEPTAVPEAATFVEAHETLGPQNLALKNALLTAVSAIYHLSDAGSVALDIDIRGGKPILQVNKPPAFCHGVSAMTVTSKGYRQRRMAANFHGAQIEWTERERIDPCVGGVLQDITQDIYRRGCGVED